MASPFYKTLLFKIFAFFIILYCLIWVLSSPIIKYFAKEPLAKYGLTLAPGSYISFNPFLTRVTVADLELLKNNKPVFKAGHLILQVALHKIPFDIIELEKLSMNKVSVDIEKNKVDLWVAGINLTSLNPPETTKEDTTSSQPAPYQVKLDSLALSNSTINILYNGAKHTFAIQELLINKINANQNEQSAELKLTSSLDGATIILASNLNLKDNKGSINNDIKISKYSLSKIKHFIEPVEMLDGLLSFNSTQIITLSDEGINIKINNTSLNTEKVLTRTKEQSIYLESLTYDMNDAAIELAKVISTDKSETTQLKSITGSAKLILKNGLVEALPHEENLQASNTKTNNPSAALPKIVSFSALTLNNVTPKLLPKLSPKLSPKLQPKLPPELSSELSSNDENNIAINPAVLIESLELEQLLFSQVSATDLPPVATIKNISISNIKASAEALSINEINISGIISHIILNKEKALANLVDLASSQTAKAETLPTKKPVKEPSEKSTTTDTQAELTTNQTANIPPEKSTKKPYYISINAFNIIKDNQIDFLDNSVNPTYKRSFSIEELAIGKLSNLAQSSENKTPITLKGKSNDYANFAFDGFVQPFAQQKVYHIKGFLNELSLPDVSTYMKDALQLELKSGQLNTKLEVTLTDDDLDGEVSININGLETTAVNSQEANLIKDQVGIPFNTALGMLKDGNGDLVLDVPLSGKTSSPSFGISSFIALITKKAVMSATQDYLMATFVPYANIVSVAMTAGEFILKLRFEDLPYQAKQVEPDEKQTEYIEQFIAVMKDQKNTRVRICAISTPADIGAAANQKLSEVEVKALITIGHEREKAFKAYVVKDKAIETGRILLCAPQIDTSKNAIPRMVISV